MKKILLLLVMMFSFALCSMQTFGYYNTSWEGTNEIAGQTGTYDFEFTTTDASYRTTSAYPYIEIRFPEDFVYDGTSLLDDILISTGGALYHPHDALFTTGIGQNIFTIYFCENGGSPCDGGDPLFEFPSDVFLTAQIANVKNTTTPGSYSRPSPALYSDLGGEPWGEADLSPSINIIADPFVWCAMYSGDINIPYEECAGLAHLYLETNGANWWNNFNWFDNFDVTTWENGGCDDSFANDSFDACDDLFSSADSAIALTTWTGVDGKYHVNGIMLPWNELEGAIQSGLISFPELTYLNLDDNYLTEIDLTGNPNLVYADLGDNDDSITRNLDLSQNPLLQYLEVDDLALGSMSAITFASGVAANMLYLDLDGNNISTADLSSFSDLEYLDLNENALSGINLSTNIQLKNLDLYNNQLTSINLSTNTQLITVYLDDNSLTSLVTAPRASYTEISTFAVDDNLLCRNSLSASTLTLLDELDSDWESSQHAICSTPSTTGGGGSISSVTTSSSSVNNADDDNKDRNEDSKDRDTESNETTEPNQENTTESSPTHSDEDPKFDSETESAYEFAYARGMTTLAPIEKADLEGFLLRSHMAKILVEFSVSELDREADKGKACVYNDLAGEDTEMQKFIVLSCQMGIMGLQGDGVTPQESFDPNGQVTRAQVVTVLSRMLWGNVHDGATPWYADHMKAMKEHGYVTVEDPDMIEKRGNFLIILQRLASSLDA